MAATLADVRQAIADTLAEALPAVNVYPYMEDTVAAPAVLVQGFEQTPAGFGTLDTVVVSLLILVSRQNVSQLAVLDSLIDAQEDVSVPVALAADPTLGGAVSYCVWRSQGDYGEYEWGGASHYGAVVRLEVSP